MDPLAHLLLQKSIEKVKSQQKLFTYQEEAIIRHETTFYGD